MAVEDYLMPWFLRNIVVPGVLDINNPGFIITRFGGSEVYRRELFYAEELLSEIEIRFAGRYGRRGRIALYKAGKKFGYAYSKFSQFPTIASASGNEIKKFSHLLIMFVSAIWASKLEVVTLDPNAKKFRIRLWDYVVCSKNGLGDVLGTGGIAGIWAYLMQDNSVEGVQINCQGMGAPMCEFYIAPADELKKGALPFFTATDINVTMDERYHSEFNKVRQARHATHSMRQLIDARIFDYSNRQLKFSGTRYFSAEISLYYILETELSKLKGGNELLFDICFEFGRKLAANGTKDDQFIMDYLSAIGFGDALCTTCEGVPKIGVNYFPWTGFSGKTNYAMFRGLVSGLFSGALNKKIKFKKAKTELVGSDFSVSLE